MLLIMTKGEIFGIFCTQLIGAPSNKASKNLKLCTRDVNCLVNKSKTTKFQAKTRSIYLDTVSSWCVYQMKSWDK